MHKPILILLLSFSLGLSAQNNIGIGTQNPDPSALVEMYSKKNGSTFTKNDYSRKIIYCKSSRCVISI